MAKLLQTDLHTRMYRATSAFNEAYYLAANEPSLGMFRIQEHVNLTVPKIVEQRVALGDMCKQVVGACFDLDYDTQTVKAMTSIAQFRNIRGHIRKAIELTAKLEELERTQMESRETQLRIQDSALVADDSSQQLQMRDDHLCGSVNPQQLPPPPPPMEDSPSLGQGGGDLLGISRTDADLQSDESDTFELDFQPKSFN